MAQAVLFYLFALVAILAGIGVVTARNPIASAISLVVAFFFLSGIYAMLDAHFVAVTQVLVYAGAIMVLFLFVIMLLNLRDEGIGLIGELAPRAIIGLAIAGFVGIGLIIGLESMRAAGFLPTGPNFGTIEAVGLALFSGGRDGYLLPFEVASALLTVAMIGAVVLAKREI